MKTERLNYSCTGQVSGQWWVKQTFSHKQLAFWKILKPVLSLITKHFRRMYCLAVTLLSLTCSLVQTEFFGLHLLLWWNMTVLSVMFTLARHSAPLDDVFFILKTLGQMFLAFRECHFSLFFKRLNQAFWNGKTIDQIPYKYVIMTQLNYSVWWCENTHLQFGNWKSQQTASTALFVLNDFS